MKLRTEVVDGKVRPSMHSGYDVEHDLLAAHALLRAVDEWAALSVAEMINYDANDWIKQRAAEILAGWMGEERG